MSLRGLVPARRPAHAKSGEASSAARRQNMTNLHPVLRGEMNLTWAIHPNARNLVLDQEIGATLLAHMLDQDSHCLRINRAVDQLLAGTA